MRSISKSAEPMSLTKFRKSNPVNWDEIHKHENNHVYYDCITKCLEDQNGLCGYTELMLNESIRHIDHFVKRDLDASMTFVWDNMIAAVKDSRFGAGYKDKELKHNDYDNVNKRYNCLYNPVVDVLDDVFIYFSDGSIEPADKNDTKADNTIKVFNLNEKSLKQKRKQVMEFVRQMKDGNIAKEDIYDILKDNGFHSCLIFELNRAFQ